MGEGSGERDGVCLLGAACVAFEGQIVAGGFAGACGGTLCCGAAGGHPAASASVFVCLDGWCGGREGGKRGTLLQ